MANGGNPLAQVSDLAKGRLEVFRASIRDDGTYKTGIYRGVQSTSQQISDDYGTRFLIELIQNAYDAHPSHRHDGRIRVRLASEEGQSGVLYVANQGDVFVKGDVDSLCDIGTSNKPIGQSIGNKGLGFRSVHYVTDDPQIYSKADAGSSRSFDGYCFRFARGHDFDRLLEETRHRDLAKKDIPFFHIPLALTRQPASVLEFARDGFSTVIRLPLRTASHVQLVLRLLREMRAQDAPLLLFLQRIESLEVVIDGEPQNSFCLQRTDNALTPTSSTSGVDRYSCIDLGSGEKYFLAWHMIPEAQVKGAIHHSIMRGQLHPDWKDWEGDGELAVAVKLNGDVTSPRLYTYLPMSDQAICPFHGYLHGSFYPKADRASLDASIPINGLYLDEAPRLCVRAIRMLREMHGSRGGLLSRPERRTAIADLLAWRPSQSIQREGVSAAPILMREAFREVGTDFPELDALPTVSRKGSHDWGTPRHAWRWEQPDLKAFGADSVARILNQAILDPELGQERLDRLEEFISKGDDDLTVNPTEIELARMTEALADHFLTRAATKKSKTEFYLEFERVFRNRPFNLSGRRILYCSDGLLRASASTQEVGVITDDAGSGVHKRGRRRPNSSATVVFSPSSRSIDGAGSSVGKAQVLQVPKELEMSIAFLSDELDWYRGLAPVRELLEGRGLIRRYDAIELVTHASRVSRNNRNTRVRKAVLSWVFDLWLSYRDGPRSFNVQDVNLLVPTIEGKWIEAHKAIFSAGWPSWTLGSVTEALLMQTASCSEDLARIGKDLLAHKIAKPFTARNAEDWAAFLAAVGVKKGLQPLSVEIKELSMLGWGLTAEKVADRFQMDQSTKQYWQLDVDENGGKPRYAGRLHQLQGSLWCFPGQGQYGEFSEDTRMHYAQLILQWLGNAESQHLEVTLFAPSACYQSPFNWPTPLAAFLRRAPWFPVEVSEGWTSRRVFLRPADVWLPKVEDYYRWPNYMPGIPRELRCWVFDDPTLDKLIKCCRMNALNDRVSLARQVWYLGRLYKEGRVDSSDKTSFMNLYNDTWYRLANADTITEELTAGSERYLITQRHSQYTYVDVSTLDDGSHGSTSRSQTGRQEIYVRDSDNTLGIAIVVRQGSHLFDLGSQNAKNIANLLRGVLGGRFKAVSDIQVTIVVDGREYVRDDSEQFAVKICPWLTHVVSLSMESLKGPEAQRLPADRSIVISRLRKVRIRNAREVQLRVENTCVSLTESTSGAIALIDDSDPLLIIQSDTDDLGWDALADASREIARLIGQTDLTNPIKLCLRKLQLLQEPATGAISDYSQGVEGLCRELGVEPTHAKNTLEGLGRNITRLTWLLRPVICFYIGVEASKLFADSVGDCRTLPNLVEKLTKYLEGTTLSADSLVDVCQRATGFADIQRDLGLSFGGFNRSLIAVGEDPITYPDSQAAAVRSFVERNKDTIMNCLRVCFADRFKKRESLEDYIRCRKELEGLQPKEEWAIEYPAPPDSGIKMLINDWLARNGAPAMSGAQKLLPSWSKVCLDNKARIKRLVHSHGSKVKAWCYKRGNEPPGIWIDANASDSICNRLHDLGALDFEILEEPDLISWLVIDNIWPNGMPETTALVGLGLDDKDLEEESNRELAARLHRQREARSIVFNGRQVDPQDPQEADAEMLAEEVRSKLPRSITAMNLGRMARLKVIPESKTGKRGSGGSGTGGGGPRIAHEKTELIGFLGECAVYHWLKKTQPKKDIESAWKSRNRSRLLPGVGDDSLGYDFEVTYRRQTWYLEVKSSLGDTREFELGDTEIRKARDCAAKTGQQYRIVYVSNIHDCEAMGVEVLPNPLSEEGKAFFRIGGQGIRYHFSRK